MPVLIVVLCICVYRNKVYLISVSGRILSDESCCYSVLAMFLVQCKQLTGQTVFISSVSLTAAGSKICLFFAVFFRVLQLHQSCRLAHDKT